MKQPTAEQIKSRLENGIWIVGEDTSWRLTPLGIEALGEDQWVVVFKYTEPVLSAFCRLLEAAWQPNWRFY